MSEAEALEIVTNCPSVSSQASFLEAVAITARTVRDVCNSNHILRTENAALKLSLAEPCADHPRYSPDQVQAKIKALNDVVEAAKHFKKHTCKITRFSKCLPCALDRLAEVT